MNRDGQMNQISGQKRNAKPTSAKEGEAQQALAAVNSGSAAAESICLPATGSGGATSRLLAGRKSKQTLTITICSSLTIAPLCAYACLPGRLAGWPSCARARPQQTKTATTLELTHDSTTITSVHQSAAIRLLLNNNNSSSSYR